MEHDEKKIARHALILVFEYNLNRPLFRDKIPTDVPNTLLGMDRDLANAYRLAADVFNIERRNITVITDVGVPPGSKRPWGTLRGNGDNPRIVQLQYPDITQIIREIAQFVENTTRGIEDIVTKGESHTNEVFIYFSCHGSRIPALPSDDDEICYGPPEDMDNALIFMTQRSNKYFERRYFRDNDIFNLLFGLFHIDEDGSLRVPITRRTKFHPDTGGDAYYVFEDDEICKFRLTPSAISNSQSGRQNYISPSERGLPAGTHMLIVFDTCHSGTMADFHYVYDADTKEMKESPKLPSHVSVPYCISLAASEDTSEAPSTSNGSPFTQSLYTVFREARCGMDIHEFHKHLYAKIPMFLKTCKPTISSTMGNPNLILPFLENYDPCTASGSLPIPRH